MEATHKDDQEIAPLTADEWFNTPPPTDQGGVKGSAFEWWKSL